MRRLIGEFYQQNIIMWLIGKGGYRRLFSVNMKNPRSELSRYFPLCENILRSPAPGSDTANLPGRKG